MVLDKTEQVVRELGKAGRVFIALPEQPDTDTIAASLALWNYLKSKNVYGVITSSHFTLPKKLSFLPNAKQVQSAVPPLRSCVISVDTKSQGIADIGYKKDGDRLRVFITPKEGILSPQAISIDNNKYSFDLIITVNAADLESLGALFADHRQFFYDVPIINIDHRPENEQYGQINLVDINASSACEILYKIFYSTNPPTPETATLLLSGILEGTHALRSAQVTPNTLDTLSRLIAAGAAYQDATLHLYRTKTIDSLKLWGHVLAHLQADKELSFAWSLIPKSILSVTGTDTYALHDLMDEVLQHSPEAKTVLLFIEHSTNETEIFISTKTPLNAKDLIKDWSPRGSERFAKALVDKNLKDAENEVVPVVKGRLRRMQA